MNIIEKSKKDRKKNILDEIALKQNMLSSPPAQPISSGYVPSFNKTAIRSSSSSQSSTGYSLPSNTEIHTVSPSAAGFPVLEVVRRLESENILTKEDRLALKDGLYSSDVTRREEVVKALCEVELSMNSRFAIRKLKSVIHQNNTGLCAPTSAKETKLNYINSLIATGGANTNNSGKDGKSGSNVSVAISTTQHPQYSTPRSGRQEEGSLLRSSFPVQASSGGKQLASSLSAGNLKSGSGAGKGIAADVSNDISQFEMKLNLAQLAGNSSGKHSSRNKLQPQQLFSPYMNNDNNVNVGALSHSSPEQQNATQRNLSSDVNGTPIMTSPLQQQQQIQNDFDENINILSAINQVVGDFPLYSGPSHYNVLDKISARLSEFLLLKQTDNRLASNGKALRFAVVVGCGSFNPLTRMHLRTFYLAKQYIESKLGFNVLGTLLSPAHGVTVRERFRTNTSEIIPSPHRLAVAQLLVQNSKWLSIDPWELTRRRPMDYLSLLEHVQAMLLSHFPEVDIRVVYFSKANQIPKLSPQALRQQNFSVVSVCRAPESDVLRASLTGKWNGLISVVEDTAILDASLDVVTSRKVRDKVRAGESVAHLVGEKIHEYVLLHHIGQKMNGLEDWSAEEKLLPKFASRPAEPVLRSQSVLSSNGSVMSGSSMGYRAVGTSNSSYTPSWSGATQQQGTSSAGILRANASNTSLPGVGSNPSNLNHIKENTAEYEDD